ncbi:tetratricopeptide repeat protein [Kamptonema cortianum]|nr:tetratricopeptide repeat protein [Geitlerinema splendidum]MDK3157573.1 tetratricopeptide repeat protein [Kamptonema cortianum]
MSYIGKWFAYGKSEDLDQGIRLYERGEFQESLKFFVNVLRSSADTTLHDRARSYFAGAHGQLARIAITSRQFEEARTHLSEALEVRPGFADLWLLKARVERILGEDSRAEFALERALWLNEFYGAAYVELGVLRYRSNQPDEAIVLIQKGIELDPRLATPDFDAGLKFHHTGDYKKAVDHFGEIRPTGHLVNDLLREADQLANQRKWSDAVEAFSKAIAMAPEYADLAVRRGQCYLELNELELAIQDFERSIEINSNFADAHALLGIAYRRNQNEDRAMAAFRAALKINSRHPIASEEVMFRPM